MGCETQLAAAQLYKHLFYHDLATALHEMPALINYEKAVCVSACLSVCQMRG